MTNLIKELNDTLKPKDPIEEAVALAEAALDATHLDDEQVESLADYMKEIVDGQHKRGVDVDVSDAAYMALEDVAGFETAPKKVLQRTVERLVVTYMNKFGKA